MKITSNLTFRSWRLACSLVAQECLRDLQCGTWFPSGLLLLAGNIGMSSFLHASKAWHLPMTYLCRLWKQNLVNLEGPSTRNLDCLNPERNVVGSALRPHEPGRLGHWIRNLLKPVLRVERFQPTSGSVFVDTWSAHILTPLRNCPTWTPHAPPCNLSLNPN